MISRTAWVRCASSISTSAARRVRRGSATSGPEAEVEAEFSSRRVREAGHAGGQPDEDDGYQDNVGMDDLAPETLIDESGARSPAERGGESPADKRLRVVHGNEIGAGHGLDEAELARRDPLDGSSDEER